MGKELGQKMFKRTAVDLGLDLVLKAVLGHALSPNGSQAVINAIPVFHQEEYLKRQSQVSAVMYAISEASSENDMRVEAFPDLGPVFDSIMRNPTMSLEGEQVFNVGLYIRSARLLKTLMGLSLRLGCKDKDSGVDSIITEIPENLLYL